ncbi:MAG: peptidylprolyl isomerase [Oscillospiraceae bacterium]|nr:peptidylprolyl isomerase [Oscillospiraceae bacterium]
MFGDLIGRAASTIDADGEPDSEILGYARAAAGGRSSASKKKEPEENTGRKIPGWAIAALCCVLIAAVGTVALFLKGRGEEPNGGTGTYDGPVSGDNGDDEMFANYRVVMEIKNYGTIELELDTEAAPRTVKNFVDLANAGFYDGLTFHRIIEGFMIQGGDPEGNGSGGSKKKIIGEFSANGVENPISHTRGVISMARSSNDYNSARSQFFIVQQDSTYLDGQYAAFGHVISGMDVVDKIAADARPIDNNGTIPAEEQPVILSVTVSVI